MAMKKVIKALTDVIEAYRSEYVAAADGTFVLAVEGEEDTSALKNAYERTKVELKDVRTERDKLKTEKETAEAAALVASGDIKAIKESYDNKITALENAQKEAAKKAERAITEAKKVEIADTIAKDISTVPLMMRDQVMKRLKVTLQDDVPVPLVLDKDGKASAMSLEELKAELLANKEFAPILIASKAKGGGAGTQQSNGPPGTGSSGGDTPAKQLAKMTDMERSDWFRRDPDGFKKASAELHSATTNM